MRWVAIPLEIQYGMGSIDDQGKFVSYKGYSKKNEAKEFTLTLTKKFYIAEIATKIIT